MRSVVFTEAVMQLRASKGLGDAIYLRAAALHLVERGEAVEVFTIWPEVFADTGVKVRSLDEITGDEDWRSVKSCLHCRILNAPDAFTMACLQAGIVEPVRLRLDWRVRNAVLVERVRREARGRPVLVYQPPKLSPNLNDRLSRPTIEAYGQTIEGFRDHFRVRIGHPRFVESMAFPCDLDLFGLTSVSDALDVCSVADRFVCEPSYVQAVAEALDKPYTCVFSRRAVESGRTYISNLKPERVGHKPHLMTAVFDEVAACAS